MASLGIQPHHPIPSRTVILPCDRRHSYQRVGRIYIGCDRPLRLLRSYHEGLGRRRRNFIG